MRLNCLLLCTPLFLAGCGAEAPREYDMGQADAESKLLTASFDRGILPGWSGLKPDVVRNYDGAIEWVVLDHSENGNGWWCPITIAPSGDEGSKLTVDSDCVGPLASQNNANLDELIDAMLSERPINVAALK